MVHIIGPYFMLETDGDDIAHTDEIWEAFQAVIEGFVDDNGLAN